MSHFALASAFILTVCSVAWFSKFGDGKETVLSSKAGVQLRYTQKIRGPLTTSLSLGSAIPENAGDVFVMRGILQSERDIENVSFKWAIPKGVEVVNGALSGKIDQIKADQPVEIQITLKNLEAKNHQIHLVAHSSLGGARFASSSQYNTLLQTLLEDSMKNLAASTEADAKAQKAELKQSSERHHQHKIFH